MDQSTKRLRARARYVAVAVGVLLVAIAGYVGFVRFVESDQGVGAGVIALAAATGFAAFFSPCSFPLLLTFLARRADESWKAALASALRVGAGAAFLLMILAIVIVAGGSALARLVEFDSTAGRGFRLLVGLLLIILGLAQARLINLRMRWRDRVASAAGRILDPSKATKPARSDVMYGFGYLLAGFG